MRAGHLAPARFMLLSPLSRSPPPLGPSLELLSRFCLVASLGSLSLSFSHVTTVKFDLLGLRATSLVGSVPRASHRALDARKIRNERGSSGRSLSFGARFPAGFAASR